MRDGRAARHWSSLLAAVGLVLIPTLASGASPERPSARDPDGGPFEERNQFLFNLLFLAFPARGGDLLPPGEQRILLSQTYSNTFVGSNAFRADPTPGSDDRVKLTPMRVAAAQASEPGESLFFVDGEQGRSTLAYRAGVSQWFEAGAEIPFLSYRGGTFDTSIESYHDRFGFENGGREHYGRDRAQITLSLGKDSLFTDRTPSLLQLGDISLFGRVSLLRAGTGSLALALGVKLPTGDPNRLGGSGGADVGIDLESTVRRGRHRIHASAGWIRTGDWSLFPRFSPSDPVRALFAYEFAGRESLAWIVQIDAQTTVFRDRTGNDLSEPTSEVLAGVRWNPPRSWFFEAALIENVFNQNNSIDVGVWIAAGRRLTSPTSHGNPETRPRFFNAMAAR